MSVRDDYKEFVLKALNALSKPATVKQVTEWISSNCLIPSEHQTRRVSGNELFFVKEIRWARKELYDEGRVTSPRRGVWDLP
jgi:hypothetical protein